MAKRQLSITIEDDANTIIDRLAKNFNITKSAMLNLSCYMLDTYFSDAQIGLEIETHEHIDRRKKQYKEVKKL